MCVAGKADAGFSVQAQGLKQQRQQLVIFRLRTLSSQTLQEEEAEPEEFEEEAASQKLVLESSKGP